MKLIFVTFILLIASVGNSMAITNEGLYEACKKFTDRSFEFTDYNDFLCAAYFSGVGEMSRVACEAETRTGLPYHSDNLNASIQHYVNYMKQNPSDWKYNAALKVWVSVREITGTECPPSG